MAVVTAFAIGACTAPALALGYADFRTPGRAAYCGFSEGESPVWLICWTPDDGYTVAMRPQTRPESEYNRFNRRLYQDRAPVLRFGRSRRLFGYRCTSRRTGLTCRNRAGHGWWLGRYHGVRLF